MPYISDRKAAAYQERIRFERRPVTADIFLTDFCQLSCVYCRYHKVGGFMRAGLFRGIIARLVDLGVLGVVLTGGGEPTLDPDFSKICHDLEVRGIPYGVNTNLIDPVYNVEPAFIKVSIDSATAADYEARRGHDFFDRVVENLRTTARLKAERTVLGVQAVITEPGQAAAFIDRFIDEPVDYISLRPLEKKGPYRMISGQLYDEILALPHHERVTVSYKWEYLRRRYSACHLNWAVLTVNHLGDVMYCCNKPDEIVGSVFDPGILERRERWVTRMDDCEVPCRLSGTNDVQAVGGDHLEFI